MGLYFSKGIVAAHGGRMWAESPGHGRGSAFCFTLPLREPQDAPRPAEARA
jgi:signal transduction histidine kinase